MQSLIPCPSCRRHVSTAEAACPFCSVKLTDHLRSLPTRPAPRLRLGRSALFVYGATAALASVAATACQSDDGPVGSGASHDGSTMPSKPHDASTMPGKSQDASAAPSKPQDASADAHTTLGRDAAPEASDAAVATDARVTAQRDAGDAARPLDAAAEPSFDSDAEVFVPLYALVAPPPSPAERSGTVPALARPDPTRERYERDRAGPAEQDTPSASSDGQRVST